LTQFARPLVFDGSTIRSFEVIGCKATSQTYKASGVSPAVLLERHIDVKFDDERRHHPGVVDRLAGSLPEAIRRDGRRPWVCLACGDEELR
jgi:hypothetical protein